MNKVTTVTPHKKIIMKRPIKHNIIIILGLFVIMFGISIFKRCSGRDNSKELGPEATLQEFYSQLCAGEFDKAEELCDTLHLSEYIGTFKQTWNETDSTVCAIASAILSEMTVTVTDTEKNGQTRTLFYRISSTSGSEKEKMATLKKVEGAWKIEKITDRI